MPSIPKSQSGVAAKYFAWLQSRWIHFLIQNSKDASDSRIKTEFDGPSTGLDVCVGCALIVLGQTFFFFSFLLCSYKSESGLMKMKHLRSLTSGSVLTPANAGCYNYPAGVSESPPTADAICLLTSARATAEPDFPRLCE